MSPGTITGVYSVPILALVLALVVQSAVISALLLQRARRARAAQAVRDSEERFRLLADRAPVLLWTTRPDTTLDYLNRTCSEFTGLPLDQLLDNGWLDAVHPDDVDRCKGIYVPAIEARRPFFMEYRVRRADGAYGWLLDLAVPKYREDGVFSGYVGASTDITDRKKAEESIRENEAALQESYREIQRLAGSLITAQDSERARISRDLHDDVSQQLAALSISLSTLKRRIGLASGDPELQQAVSAIQQRTVALAESVRNLSHDLHPDVLRHAGLTGTLEARCAEIARDRDLAVSWSAEGDVDVIDANTSFCLYRIAQESLHNVVKHAEAQTASVVLRCVNGSAELTIADNGKGFDIAEMRRRRSGLGLLSISERVRLAQGTLSVVTEAGKGTQIRVRLPLHRPPHEAGDGSRPYATA